VRLKFYDDTVRDGLAVLADSVLQKRLWRGMEPGRNSSPFECFMGIFEDSGLAGALDAGEAYGEPVDGLLRRLFALMDDLDLNASLDDLESDERFTSSRLLAERALDGLKSRPLGTVRGEPLDPR
jgi:hypothetical protein